MHKSRAAAPADSPLSPLAAARQCAHTARLSPDYMLYCVLTRSCRRTDLPAQLTAVPAEAGSTRGWAGAARAPTRVMPYLLLGYSDNTKDSTRQDTPHNNAPGPQDQTRSLNNILDKPASVAALTRGFARSRPTPSLLLWGRHTVNVLAGAAHGPNLGAPSRCLERPCDRSAEPN
jgi:hypothetical protein